MEAKDIRPASCKDKDFAADPNIKAADGTSLRAECCRSLPDCGEGYTPKGGLTECVGKTFGNSTSNSHPSKDHCCQADNSDQIKCMRTYVTSSGRYQACCASNEGRFSTYTDEQKRAIGLGDNPHPACKCVRNYVEDTYECKDDPTWGPSIMALIRGANQASWMGSCRTANCDGFICKAGTHPKPNPASIRCGVPGGPLSLFGGMFPGQACDPEGDQGTCCDSGNYPARCTSMQCPGGYTLKSGAYGIKCKTATCTVDDDRDTCCDQAKCPGAITFDYGDKQEECAAVGDPVWAAASECYDEDNCQAMTDCYARVACKHSKMKDSCSDRLSVCVIKPGGTVYSSWSHSSSSSHCSNGDCTHQQTSASGGITSSQCDPNNNPDSHSAATCPS